MTIKRFPFNMFPVNCYVLSDDTGEAVIIDAGCLYEEEKATLKAYIATQGLKLKHLLCTHLHLDHIFGNAFIQTTYGLVPEANPADDFLLRNAPQQAMLYGFQLTEPVVPTGRHLADGDTLTFGHQTLEVIHVPGHSPGSLVFYHPAAGCLFGGDVLFRDSIGRADLPGGDYQTLIQAIRRKLFVLPPDTIVYTGHGQPTTIGYEKTNNPFFK